VSTPLLPSLPLTLRPKKTKMLLLFLLCAVFTAGGIWMVLDGEKMGWFCGGFFALGLPVFLLQLHPRCSFLIVTDEGLEISALFRKSTIRWEDIAEFGVYRLTHHGLPVNAQVGFNYAADYQKSPRARAVAKALTGFEGALPDTYGCRAEELAQLLAHIHCLKLHTKNA
jgi:hypothetical protein